MAGALVKPNGITVYSKSLYLYLNAVFYSSPLAILIWWYPSVRSNTINTSILYIRSSNSEISSSGPLFLRVISFSYL